MKVDLRSSAQHSRTALSLRHSKPVSAIHNIENQSWRDNKNLILNPIASINVLSKSVGVFGVL